MIQRMSHVTIWVLNQDEAHDFYVNKWGFTSIPTQGWTTVSRG